MAKVTPIVNGVFAPVHGSFVVGPNLPSGLDIDGYRIDFLFAHDETGDTRANVIETVSGITLEVINPSTNGSSLDLAGFQIDQVDATIHLVFITIGLNDPHRLIAYTVSQVPVMID